MTNLAMEHALAKLGIPFARAKVGDRYVLELMQERGWMLGGENSGHILCLDRHTTGDGIISALQVLEALKLSGKSLSEFTQELVLYPQVLINVRVEKGFDFKSSIPVLDVLAQAEQALDGEGRVLLRPSGTEPLLRVMVEGKDEAKVRHWAETLAAKVRESAMKP
jgi:phosphoglucosamine mutase